MYGPQDAVKGVYLALKQRPIYYSWQFAKNLCLTAVFILIGSIRVRIKRFFEQRNKPYLLPFN